MHLNIHVPYIRCERTTYGIGKDEIYFALMVVPAKKVGNKVVPTGSKPVFFEVSSIQGAVDGGSQWTPTPSNLRIDIGDAEAVAVTMALYECDSGAIRDQMISQGTGFITPPGFDWGNIVIPVDPTNPANWIAPLWSLLREAFKFFPQDDLIAHDSISVEVGDPNLPGPRDKILKGCGGKFHFLIELSIDL